MSLVIPDLSLGLGVSSRNPQSRNPLVVGPALASDPKSSTVSEAIRIPITVSSVLGSSQSQWSFLPLLSSLLSLKAACHCLFSFSISPSLWRSAPQPPHPRGYSPRVVRESKRHERGHRLILASGQARGLALSNRS